MTAAGGSDGRKADVRDQYEKCGSVDGAGTRSRTRDLLITSQLLYQLSYTGKGEAIIAMEKPL